MGAILKDLYKFNIIGNYHMVDFIDVLQAREYNEKTGQFHNRISRGNNIHGSSQLLCNSTDRIFTPFFNFVHKVFDFDSKVCRKDSRQRPRPSINELRAYWDFYLSLYQDITYYNSIKVTDK